MSSGFLERILRPRRLALLALIPAALWAAGRLWAQPAASGLTPIIHERLRPSRGSWGFRGRHAPPAYGRSPDTSSDLLCDGKVRRGTFWSPVPPRTVAVVGLPRPDEKSLAGTRRTLASQHLDAKDRSSLNDIRVFRPGVRELSGLRVVVLERDYRDPEGWRAIAALGANVVVTLAAPDLETDRLAAAAGLAYLAFLTTDEIESLARDPARVAQVRAESSLAGFHFLDTGAVEGFTTPQAQQRAYETLKSLFPGKLVLYPTRLDPIAWESGFLDSYFRPEFTDLVTPYFYPVGTTILGHAWEEDAWGERLAGLLSALAPRIPAGKGVLPVLQGFEQIGYPVGARFVPGQMAVYRRFWPDLSNAAVFVWKFADPSAEPLIEMADKPLLQQGTCFLFATLSGRLSRCRAPLQLPWR